MGVLVCQKVINYSQANDVLISKYIACEIRINVS
jgi:hypothetical protein